MQAVTLERVHKRFGKVIAADDVSLSIRQGEFFALLGPSGSGKTTVLRMIAGFLHPDRGTICIDGRPIQEVPPYQRQIGMVFQSYALFPHMTVFDNVAFGLAVRRTPKPEIRRRVSEMMRLVRLPGLENRRPHELSGGQQQRIALARALITNPKVVLLDEPLAALDKRLREEMQFELKRIQREVGITALFVTHDQEEALTLSDRIAIMNNGRVEQVGTPAELYEKPGTAFVAGFLGDANFFTGRVTAPGEGHGRPGQLTTEDGLTICTTHPLPAVGGQVTVIVRPERFTLHPQAPERGAGELAGNAFPAEVKQVVYSGKSITYVLAAYGREFKALEQNRSPRSFRVGDTVWVSWSAEHAVVVRP